MKLQWPPNWGTSSVLVELDQDAIPILLRAIERADRQSAWANWGEWEQAHQGLNEIRKALLMPVGSEIVQAIDRLYRLINSIHNGQIYTAEPDELKPGNYIYSPAIPVVPSGEFAYPGERAQLEHIRATNDNLVSGQTYPTIAGNTSAKPLTEEIGLLAALIELRGELEPAWFGIGGKDATLADIIRALRAGDEQDELDFRNLANTAKAATTVETLQDALTDFMSNGILAGKDAAIGLSGLVGQLGQMTMLGLLTKELQRIRHVLHPDPVPLPGDVIPVPPLRDTIIEALRGSEPATSSRNVIDRLGTATATDEAILAALLGIKDAVE